VVLITGTAPQEGKTTTLVNVARLLAGSGETTVVVDCDLRRAQLHHRFGLPREPGFTDVFTKHEELDLIQETRVPNLFAIRPAPANPPGSSPESGSAIFSTAREVRGFSSARRPWPQ
jgi:Mrp family chromosome partitioning ATPase